jgi:hypothetical protein
LVGWCSTASRLNLPAPDRLWPPGKIDRPGIELDHGGRFLPGCEFVRSKWLVNQPE